MDGIGDRVSEPFLKLQSLSQRLGSGYEFAKANHFEVGQERYGSMAKKWHKVVLAH